MIRIVLLSLLTLNLSCAQATPDKKEQTPVITAAESPAPEPVAQTLPEPEQKPERQKSRKKTAKSTTSVPALTDTAATTASVMEEPSCQTPDVPEIDLESIEEPVAIVPTEDSPLEILAYETAEEPTAELPGEESAPVQVVTDESSFGGENPFAPELLETPRKKRDTPFLPTRRRMDREINKIKYVQKGEIMMGLTASYGTLSSDDAEMWLVLDNINLDASIFTVNPFLGYFFRDNMCLGARFGYSQINGNLASAAIDLGEANDINLAVNDIKLANDNISFGIFLRSYAGLDAKGHFGLFGELELTMSSGSSEFSYMSGGEPHQTFGDNTKLKLSFNPGMAVYIFPNVCSTISFGLGGIQYTKTTQKDAEGNKTGSRTSSNMRFRLNLAEIRIGLTIHMWNKKKSL